MHRAFGSSLVYGCRNIHQSLPRMISLWLDYGARVASVKEVKKKNDMKVKLNKYILLEEILQFFHPVKVSLNKMNEFVRKCSNAWPPYYFLTVFPLLSSRICHPQEEVWHLLR